MTARRCIPLFAAAAWLLLSAAAPPVSFTPEAPRFARATEAYRALWAAEGARMAAALEAGTGLALPDAPVEVIVYEGASWAGMGGRPMRLRASYSEDEKRAALVHELGHRLIAGLPRDPAVDEHRTLFLFLYDVWTGLYGSDFADRMVRVERGRRGLYDYDAAWTWALAMTREERHTRFQALRLLGQRQTPKRDSTGLRHLYRARLSEPPFWRFLRRSRTERHAASLFLHRPRP